MSEAALDTVEFDIGIPPVAELYVGGAFFHNYWCAVSHDVLGDSKDVTEPNLDPDVGLNDATIATTNISNGIYGFCADLTFDANVSLSDATSFTHPFAHGDSCP